MQAIVRQLAALRKLAGPRVEARRLTLLAAGQKQTDTRGRTSPTRARLALKPDVLRAYHDELLFLCAYPDSPAVLRLAEAELKRIARHVAAAGPGVVEALRESGIANTETTYSFSIDLAKWLAARFARAVRLNWDAGTLGAEFDDFLPLLTPSSEIDGTLSRQLTARAWLQRAMGRARGGELAWLVRQFERLPCSPALRAHIWEGLALEVRWRAREPVASRTLARFPVRPPAFRATEAPRPTPLVEHLAQRLPPPVRNSARQTQQLVDLSRAMLAARRRETDPVTYANSGELTLFRLERGIDVLLIGMQSERRQPVESYFGFAAARNRVPIAYGGGWVFFDRCEIGVNLFEEFRGGESAYVFAQVMRVYAQHYRARQFLVDPYQFGADNAEAIQSGAFWFYHRFGFRHVNARLRRIADAEHERIRHEKGYRSPPRILKRLTGSHLFLNTGAATPPRRYVPGAPNLTEVSVALSTWIGKRFRGDRDAAERWAKARAAALLGGNNRRGWTAEEARWFDRLALWVAMIPDLEQWSPTERRELARAMRLKGGPRERDFALALQRQDRLRASLLRLGR